MLSTKQEILTELRDELEHWDALLGKLTEATITARDLPGGWAIKDVMAHLHAWQEISIARLEAGLNGGSPVYPAWLKGLDPDEEENLEQINGWIYAAHVEQPWPAVHREWRDGYLHLLDLGEAIPEQDLMAPNRYSWWVEGAPLAAVLDGTLDHHYREHYEPLTEWLADHGHSLPG